MATIPFQATGLRLARKTITFTGAANLGAVGVNELFTTTGAVAIEELFVRCTSDLVDAVDGAFFEIGITAVPDAWTIGAYLAPFDLDTINAGDGLVPDSVSGVGAGYSFIAIASGTTAIAIFDNIIMTISGQAITGGTLEFYALYRPLSDDGALAGDDIDLELGAYLADKVLDEALSGHTTAGSAGKALADIETDVDAILVDTSTTLQGELDGIQADTEDIQTRLPAALVGGRIDATIDATGMEAGAIDAILTRQMTESYAADGAAPTLAQALFEIMQALTEFAISGTTITVKKRDGSTTAMTFTLDSATHPTSRTRAT